MPDCDRFHGGPSRAVHVSPVRVMCGGEDYSEFLICMDHLPCEGKTGYPLCGQRVSLCEQRNAAMVVRVLEGERVKDESRTIYVRRNSIFFSVGRMLPILVGIVQYVRLA